MVAPGVVLDHELTFGSALACSWIGRSWFWIVSADETLKESYPGIFFEISKIEAFLELCPWMGGSVDVFLV